LCILSGLTKGSAPAGGITRRSSDSKAMPVASRFQKQISVGSRGAKRISAPPSLTGNNLRSTGERLEPLSETVSSSLVPEQIAKRMDNTKSVIVQSSVHHAQQPTWITDDDEMEEWGKVRPPQQFLVCS